VGISGRRLPRVGCARSRSGGCPLADLGLSSRARTAGRRTLGAASHVGVATTSSRTVTELERAHAGVPSWHARAFMGCAGSPFGSAACAVFTSASASGRARTRMELARSGMGPAEAPGA
jgi:hypothetical protein